jgi:hypothetical protein
VGPRADLGDVERRTFLTLPGLEFRILGRSACSQSLYRLRYPGSRKEEVVSRNVSGATGKGHENLVSVAVLMDPALYYGLLE